MGESFVALAGNQDAMSFNPAGLGVIHGARLSYALRKFDWYSLLDEFKYHQVNGALQTPYINFGFSHSRFNQGEFVVSTSQSPEGIGTGKLFDYSLAIGFGRRFGDNWDFGFSLKKFDYGLRRVSGTVSDPEITGPFLVDLGLIYSHRITSERESVVQSFSVGSALQHLGGKVKSTIPTFAGTRTIESSLPHYLRIGFMYGLTVAGETDESLQPLSVSCGGEYRTFLNGSDTQSASKDFWGFGLEMKAMEIVSVRLSGFVNPYSSVYGVKGVPALRYGLGLSLPFQKLGASPPITVQFDYAGIPSQISNDFIGSRQTKTMQVFSVSVAYENEIF